MYDDNILCLLNGSIYLDLKSILLAICVMFFIAKDLVTVIDRTLVFKDDLISSALKTLRDIERMHKNRKKLDKTGDCTKSEENYIYLRNKGNMTKSNSTRRKKNKLAKEYQITFVGIHSRLVFQVLVII